MEATASLGAPPVAVFRHVVLPLSAPGALLGLLLTFVLTVGSFVTPKLLGGGRVPLVATEIQDQAAVTLDWPVAAVLSLLTLLLFGTAGRRLWRRRPADRGGGAMTGAILRVLHGLLVAALRALLPGVEEAAASLGARPMSVALRITLPLAAPGLAAAILVFLVSFDEVVVSLFVAGPPICDAPPGAGRRPGLRTRR